MLKIQYQGLQKKEIHDGTIYLRKNLVTQVKGESKQIKYFLRELQMASSSISFFQKEHKLERKTVFQRMIFLTNPSVLDGHKSVEDTILQYYGEEMVASVLLKCELEDKKMQKVKTLSADGKTKLQLYLYASQKPILWVFDETWEHVSESVLHVLQEVLHDSMQQGCYILSGSNLENLAINYDEVSLNEEGSTPFIVTYLEDDVAFGPIQMKSSQKHHKVPVGAILLRCLFTVLLILTSMLSFTYCFVGRVQIKTIEAEFEKQGQAEEFPVIINYCGVRTTLGECGGYPVEEATRAISSMIDPLDAKITPRFNPYLLIKSDEFYFSDENGNTLPATMQGGPGSRTLFTSMFDHPDDVGVTREQYREDGIYVSSYFLENFETDNDYTKTTLHAKLLIPVYFYGMNGAVSDGMNSIVDGASPYQTLYRMVEFEAPIVGIVDQNQYGFFNINQTMFDNILKEINYGVPYDGSQKDLLYDQVGEHLAGNIELSQENVKMYYPSEYKVSFNSSQDASQGRTIFDQHQPDIQLYSFTMGLEDRLTQVYDMQKGMRNFQIPFLIPCFIATIVVALLLRRKVRNQTIPVERRFKWMKQWMYPILISLGVCFLFFLLFNVYNGPLNVFIQNLMSGQFDYISGFTTTLWMVYNFMYASISSIRIDVFTFTLLFLFTYIMACMIYVPEWIKVLRCRFQK